MTDIAAAIEIHQLRRAEEMREQREAIAAQYFQQLGDVDEIELPEDPPNRIHSWHLFPIRLDLGRLDVDRNTFLAELRESGVGCSVHWRPLHLHPYYQETFGRTADDFPVATAEWQRLISLPIFPGMTPAELAHVVRVVRRLCQRHRVAERTKDARPVRARSPRSLECGDSSPRSFFFVLSDPRSNSPDRRGVSHGYTGLTDSWRLALNDAPVVPW
jgi:hypothetical protein